MSGSRIRSRPARPAIGPGHRLAAHPELTPDAEKATVRKFAQVYGADESMLVKEEEDRYTVTYRPRRLVASPRTS